MGASRRRFGVVLLVGLLLTGCGGEEQAANEPTEEAGSFDTALCKAQLGELLAALQEIDSRLDIGMTIADYGQRLGDAKVAYDRIDFGSLEPGCVSSVGVPLENAFNEYIDAYQAWDSCIDRVTCRLSSVEPELQDHWAAASDYIDEAAAALEG